jgi:hypothetical protein
MSLQVARQGDISEAETELLLVYIRILWEHVREKTRFEMGNRVYVWIAVYSYLRGDIPLDSDF